MEAKTNSLNKSALDKQQNTMDKMRPGPAQTFDLKRSQIR
jgi:hypothetical protein